MTWFGWLTKRSIDMTGLDHMIIAAELLALAGVLFFGALLAEKIYFWWRDRK